MIRLSVVIPTFNRQQVLERSLTALLMQDTSPAEYEIIVVNDGSSDGTAEFLRHWQPKCAFHVLEAPHRGAGAARNAGVSAATGELVLFLDDDLIGVPDLLRQHCASHSSSEFRVVNGPICTAPDSSKTIIRYVIELTGNCYRSLDPTMLESSRPHVHACDGEGHDGQHEMGGRRGDRHGETQQDDEHREVDSRSRRESSVLQSNR